MILLFKNVRGGWAWDLTPILGFLKMIMRLF